ncbi:MAG: hypothetical protein ACRBC3_04275 [Burkholderiaceae bacterium]
MRPELVSASRASRLRQQGQALIEALIGGALLVTIMLLIIILGKYQATELAAIQAARAIAFDCASLPGTCQGSRPGSASVARLRSRFTGVEKPDYFHSQLWTTRSADSLLESAAHAKLSIRQESFGAMPNAARRGPAGQRHSAVEIISSAAGPGRFGLNIQHGLISANVELALLKSRGPAEPGQMLSGMALTPTAKASILTDSWNASGPYGGAESVHARVDKGWRVNNTLDRVIRAGYGGTKAFMKSMNLLFLEDQADHFKHQEIPMDLIPLDRQGDVPGAAP